MDHPEASTPFFKDFFCAASTDFADFLAESTTFLRLRPDLVGAIEADLNRHGLRKKKVREADRLFVLNQTQPLEGLDEMAQGCAPTKGDVRPKLGFLETGRPRLPAFAVGVLLLVRGYNGSCTNEGALDFLGESKSLEAWLVSQCLTLPARSTLSELLNAVTQKTRDAMLTAQLERAIQEELDDFSSILVDSTATKANSCWPTDAKTIFVLCQRLWAIGSRFNRFGLKNILPGRMESYLEELAKLPFQINLNAGKKKKFRKFCREFIELATKLLCHAHKEYKRLKTQWKQQLKKLLPSLRCQVLERVARYGESLHLASKSLEQMRQRIFEEKTFPSTERVLSLNDQSAAFIKKGGRQAVIGYKPQLARSGNGYVTALYVGEGNIADSRCLVPMVEKTIAHTRTVPNLLNVDDGYSSREGLKGAEDLGVKVVSLSGSTGKKILGEKWHQEEYRQARSGRSAVESLMFCLKHSFEFGRLGRTGLKAVRQELSEKCLAYNICRTLLLRKRKQQQPIAA